MIDPTLLAAVMKPVLAAIRAYRQAVLTRADDAAADSTIRLGQRLLARLRRGNDNGQLDAAVLDVAEQPGDEDFQIALRGQVKKAAQADPELEADLRDLLKAAGVHITATGDGAVAVQHNEGIISTGGNATNRIQGS
jgi:hypothetical protein